MEISFCAKRIDNKQWVEGFYAVQVDRRGLEIHNIMIADHNLGYFKRYKVDPETVSPYIGFKDKNGEKLFKGDIVKHYNHSDESFDIGAIYWDKNFSQWRRTSNEINTTYRMDFSCEYELIGNIYDNPELVKVAGL